MKRELWLRLARYHFDNLVPAHLVDHVTAAFGGTDASTRAFAAKLGRKLGWKTGFALRAITEYKKFVFLGVTSEFSVTPPRVIDQVWHEHILFSRPYREFCRDVLQRDFDHNPELVPVDAQTGAYEAQYAATLDLYDEEFNTEPPPDIWGIPKFKRSGLVRAGRSPLRRVDSADASTAYEATPLYTFFDGSGDGGHSHASMPEFGGGGGFTGGGGEASWTDDSGAHGSGDAGASDGGSSGSDGSGCSSSCGGGCSS